MARSIRQKNASVIQRLTNQPHQFSFYQAVRMLLDAGVARHLGAREGLIGTSDNVNEEGILFRTNATLEFCAAEIASIELPELEPGDKEHALTNADRIPITVNVNFWGLVGYVGVLPNHYTQLVIDRVRHKDTALLDFLDLFSHRQLALFYRAWEKHFVPAGIERAIRTREPESDLLRECLLSLVGRGTRSTRKRLEVLDDVCIYYGGLFVDAPNAESLQQMLADFLDLKVQVLSLFGDWLRLPRSEQTRFDALGGHCQLGFDAIVGEKTWDPAAKFRIRIGPVSYREFRDLMPTGKALVRTCQLVRSYIGCEYKFDVQVLLYAKEIPWCQLGSDSNRSQSSNVPAARLGWDTWLCSVAPGSDSEDAVFTHDGNPLVI